MLPRTAVALLLCACGSSTIGGNSDAPMGNPIDGGVIVGLASITVTPPTASFQVTNPGPTMSQGFIATGRFVDSSERDITGQVAWSLDNQAIGAIAPGGTFTTSNSAGGTGTVTASASTVSGTAQVTVTLTATAPPGPDTPPNPEPYFPPSKPPQTDPVHSPAIVYPSSETRFPINMYKVLFQWRPGGNDLFRLTFTSPNVTLRVYTSGGAGHDRYEFDLATWNFLALSNPGGTVSWTVDGVSTAAPDTVYGSAAAVIGFSRSPVPGAIYYWSTTVAGVRRATVSSAEPVDFLTPAQTGYCVACHTVSRNGERLVANIDNKFLAVWEVKKIDPPIVSWSLDYPGGWMTFSPDLSRIVAANSGTMTLRDGTTGASLGAVPLAGKFGHHPDWSPDGTNVLFAQSTEAGGFKGMKSGAIARIPYNAGAWGPVEELVPFSTENNFFPMYSFDSRFIAFVKAMGDSKDNETAKVYLRPSAAGGQVVYLERLNEIVSNADVGPAAKLGNSMPTWAPTTTPDDYYFVAFTSLREYGVVYAVNTHEQIWVAAIDPAAPAGQDASFPAFRLPFQAIDVEGHPEKNHRPFWAIDVLAPPPGADAGMCKMKGEPCTADRDCCDAHDCSEDDAGVGRICWPRLIP